MIKYLVKVDSEIVKETESQNILQLTVGRLVKKNEFKTLKVIKVVGNEKKGKTILKLENE